MVGLVKGRADKVVHGRVHDQEVLAAGALHVFDLRDQDARVAGDEPARLDQDPQAERLEQWQQPGRVLLPIFEASPGINYQDWRAGYYSEAFSPVFPLTAIYSSRHILLLF